MMEQVEQFFVWLGALMWGWPMIIFVALASLALTVGLNFIQFRAFFTGWKYIVSPEERGVSDEESITPLQAFINALSTSLGNGAIAGMATAIYDGGPGAAFWVFILGFFTMVLRFAEVYASTQFIQTNATGVLRGGPMVYLGHVFGGRYLVYVYATLCLFLSLVSGNAMQCNSIRVGIEEITGSAPYIIALGLFLFLLYIMFGGAQRIMRVAEAVIPVKVGLFFGASLLLLIYHYDALIPAMHTIMVGAFTPYALKGAMTGFTVQAAIRYGVARGLNAVEAGLGNAGILFGATGSKSPVQSGIMSMITAFISTHLVCFLLTLLLVASGVWDSGLTSTALTTAAYETLFGQFASWIVTFLSLSFGLGVLVAYAYIGRECWLFLTRGRWSQLYTWIYCSMALFGAIGSVAVVWRMLDCIVAGLIIVNLYGLVLLIPRMRRGVQAYLARE